MCIYTIPKQILLVCVFNIPPPPFPLLSPLSPFSFSLPSSPHFPTSPLPSPSLPLPPLPPSSNSCENVAVPATVDKNEMPQRRNGRSDSERCVC